MFEASNIRALSGTRIETLKISTWYELQWNVLGAVDALKQLQRLDVRPDRGGSIPMDIDAVLDRPGLLVSY